jgi:PmbA protein
MTTRSLPEGMLEVVEDLKGTGLDRVEVFHKKGRTRTTALVADRHHGGQAQEEGWAVRAGTERASFFVAESGRLCAGRWPAPDGQGLLLPAPEAAEWTAPPDLDAPLASDSEAAALLESIAKSLDSELRGARLLRAQLEDGSAEVTIASSRGVAAAYRARLCSLRAWARLGEHRVELHVAEREPRRLDAPALARRLADRLAVLGKGQPVARDRAEVLIGSDVGAALLEALAPHLVGAHGLRTLRTLADPHGRIASELVTLVDDGGRRDALLTAPVDGEGVPTRRVALIEGGELVQSLRPWWERIDGEVSGCSRRPGWRELPEPGPSHLFVQPNRRQSVAGLLQDLARGYYFLDVEGPATLDPEGDRFSVAVLGFAVHGGRPSAPVRGVRLQGSLRSLLRGVAGVARDLRFLPRGRGVVGAPTLLLTGVEVSASGAG